MIDHQVLVTLQPQEMSDRMLASHEEVMKNGETHHRQHTLEEFAIDHFRPPPNKRTLSSAVKRRTRVSLSKPITLGHLPRGHL